MVIAFLSNSQTAALAPKSRVGSRRRRRVRSCQAISAVLVAVHAHLPGALPPATPSIITPTARRTGLIIFMP